MKDLWISYFPGSMRGIIDWAYGPFESEEAAKAHAKTLSTDPDEGEIIKLIEVEELNEQSSSV